MSDIGDLKSRLRAAIGEAGSDGTYEEPVLERIHTLMEALAAATPMPRPIDRQDEVAGPWSSEFAQFGPRHTAGKPIEHDTSFKFLTFNKFPDRPLRVLRIEQEIHDASKDYNNVHIVAAPDGKKIAHLIVYGRYRIEEADPKRYLVEFHRIVLKGIEGENEEELRAAFNLPADNPLEVAMKPPALHSDVVFCDKDMRINFGSMGGAYVLRREHHSGRSVSFA